jgi:hypothetical protein
MAWDPTQPVSNAPLLSAPVRANFQALDAALALAPSTGAIGRLDFALGPYPPTPPAGHAYVTFQDWTGPTGPPQVALTVTGPNGGNLYFHGAGALAGMAFALPDGTGLGYWSLDDTVHKSWIGSSKPHRMALITVNSTGGNESITIRPDGHTELGSGVLLLSQVTTVPPGEAPFTAVYAKTDGKVYSKTPAGLETPLATTFPLFAPAALDGGLATPAFSFASSPTTGMLQMGTLAGSTTGIGLVLDGTLTVKVGPTATEFAKPILFGLGGSVALQTLSGALAQYLTGTPQIFRVHKDSATYVEIEGAVGLKLPVLTAAPGPPVGGQSVLYQKTDKKPYWKDDTGVETLLIPDPTIMTNPMTAAGDLIYGAVSGAPTRLAKGGDTQVLTLVAGVPAWQAPVSGGMTNPMTASGDLIYGAASGVATRLAKGADTQVLTLTAGLPTWQAPVSGGMTNPMSAVGDLIRGGASGAPTRLAAVALGQVLISQGVTTAPIWSTDPAIRNLLVQNGVIGTSGVGVIALGQATAPTTSPVDSFQIWTQDYAGQAGSASLYMRDERGGVIRHGTDASPNTNLDVISPDTTSGILIRGGAGGSGITTRSTQSLYIGCNTFAKNILLDQTGSVSLFGGVLSGSAVLSLGQCLSVPTTLTDTAQLYVQDNTAEAGSASLQVKDERLSVHTIGTHSVNGAGYRVINAASVQAKFLVTAAGGLIGTQSNHPLNFQTNNVTGMTLDTAGQLTVTRINASGDAGGVGLSVAALTPAVYLNKSASGQQAVLYGQTAGVNRWAIGLGDTTAETGSNAGSNFGIFAYSDAGTYLGYPVLINRASFAVTFTGIPGPVLNLNKPASGQFATIFGQMNGLNRWAIGLGDATAETGSNTGSNFIINAYTDAGAFLAQPFQILRYDGTNPIYIILGGLNRQLTLGAPDSGGAGFRMVRVSN